jgi:hypothetical protein
MLIQIVQTYVGAQLKEVVVMQEFVIANLVGLAMLVK